MQWLWAAALWRGSHTTMDSGARLVPLPMEVIDEGHFRQALEASNMDPG
jgi:hypothetical protein